MIDPEIRDAIEAARQEKGEPGMARLAQEVARQSFEAIQYTLVRVLSELPDYMTVRDMLDELEIGNNQEPKR